MPLINCKVELSLTWGEKCILSGTADAAAAVETAATFKTPNNGTGYIRKLIDASYPGLKQLFALAYGQRINDDNNDADDIKLSKT